MFRTLTQITKDLNLQVKDGIKKTKRNNKLGFLHSTYESRRDEI